MSLSAGTRLGPYELVGIIGEGGMGQVYRAQDTQLGRVVALKILPADAVADPDRKKRFIHEAKAASALNHPGIVTIYQIGAEGAVDFIAMEFVAGRSLADVMGKRTLPIADAVRYGVQIADALGAAHQAGIVHRDLKPANVMVTERGIKILDFGVAKLAERAPAGPADVTSISAPVTEVGMVIGTAAYMSPEQARGDQVDQRTDIFSFGVMLFEMLTGRRPAPGNTDALPASVPRDLHTIVRRCLQPDPRRRFQHVDDLRLALEDVDVTAATTAPPPAKSRRSVAMTSIVAVAVVAAAGMGATAAWWFLRPRPAGDVMLQQLTLDANLTRDLAISPDGRLIAYASDRAGGNFDIWVQQVAGGDARRLTTDAAADIDPSFSPDGSQIVFRSDRDGGGVYVVSSDGGDARRIADGGRRPRWSPDGQQVLFWTGPDTGFLLAEHAARVFVVRTAGGQPRQIAANLSTAWAPIWNADSRHVLMLGNQGRTPLDWWVTSIDGGDPVKTGAIDIVKGRQLTPPPTSDSFFVPEAWTRDGAVLFSARSGDSTNIWRLSVDPDGGVRETPTRVTSGAGVEVRPAIGDDGQLVFLSLINKIDLWSLPANTNAGIVTGEFHRLSDDAARDVYPSFTPDGSRMVFISNRRGQFELWSRDTATGTEKEKETVLATGVAFPSLPLVAKDGQRVYFPVGPDLRLQSLPLVGPSAAPADAAGLRCDDCEVVWDLSRYGTWALNGKNGDHVIVLREVASGRTVDYLDAGESTIGRVRISPDDRWTAFTSRTGLIPQQFVVPFRPGQAFPRAEWIPVTPLTETAGVGTWSPDGQRLYHFSDRDGHVCVWTQAIDRETGHPVGAPKEIWSFHEARKSMAQIGFPERGLAIAPDRIVVSLADSTSTIWSVRPAR